MTPNCDYSEEVEASCTSYLIALALEDSSMMDLKLKLICSLELVNKVPYGPLQYKFAHSYGTT